MSLGGECGQGAGAEQVTVTDSASFRSPEISMVGLGGESVILHIFKSQICACRRALFVIVMHTILYTVIYLDLAGFRYYDFLIV